MPRQATALARPRVLRWLQVLACLVLGFCAARPAASQGAVVIYRCTDASGAVTLQNGTPCPKGSHQQRRVMETATSVGVPAPGLAVPVMAAAASGDATSSPGTEPDLRTAEAERPLPPALYECRTFDGGLYLGERDDPPPRCVPLATTGLGGASAGGAGAACEMKRDECRRVPDTGLCERWRQRQRDTESALRFGVVEDRAQAEAELQRLARIVEESRCGAATTQ